MDNTVIVHQAGPDGKRWRWEHRDRHGHVLAVGEWATNPARAVKDRLNAAPALAAIDVDAGSYV